MRGLPEEGQEVAVIAPSGATASARVCAAGTASTSLAFEDDATKHVAVLAGGSVALQYTNQRGVCRVDGVAHAGPEQGVLRVDHTAEVQLVQRREFVRIDATLPVFYQPLDSSGWKGETTTVNVSGGGFMVSGREGLEPGAVMSFTLELDGDGRDAGPLELLGRVVREASGGLGVIIDLIDERERERLIRWVFGRERLTRQIVGAR